MDIYLIRHTTPAVAKGICYGQTDLDTTDSIYEEAAIIRRHLPSTIETVYSSPLKRCASLAAHLFPSHAIRFRDELMEIDCGRWEMRNWDELPAEELDPWMKDFVTVPIPDGESYLDLNERVSRCFNEIMTASGDRVDRSVVLVTHGGPIRSILASITGTPLIDSFKAFSLHYGCVAKISEREGILSHALLSNAIPQEKEQHKPSRFYKK